MLKRAARLAAWGLLALALALGVEAWRMRDAAEGPAPPLAGPVAAGDPAAVVEAARRAGRPVLVYFWASWCRICALTAGAIDAVGRDWPVVTVAMQSGSRGEVAAFLARHGRTRWATFADPAGRLAALWGVRGVPAWFVVGPDGTIRHRGMGLTTAAGLRLRLRLAARGATR